MDALEDINKELKKVNKDLGRLSRSQLGRNPRRISPLLSVFLFLILGTVLFFTTATITGFIALSGNDTNATSVEVNITGDLTIPIINISINESDFPVFSITDSNDTEIVYLSNISPDLNASGNYTVDIETVLDSVKHIKMRGVRGGKEHKIGLEDLTETKGKQAGWKQLYAIDLSSTEFIDGELTAVAQGNMLYKCKDWNFTTQECYGDWVKILDMMPGQEYTIPISPVDPGYGEVFEKTYYHFNTSDPEYASHMLMLNQTVGGVQYTSSNVDLSNAGIQCWPERWIAQNWTNVTLVNGTWDFTVYGGCDVTTASANLFAQIFKLNSSGEYNFANTSTSATNICDNDPGINTISYALPFSDDANLSQGERIGVSYCVDVTIKKNNKIAYLYWESTTPSNVQFPFSLLDEDAPVINLLNPSNSATTEIVNLTLTYQISDANAMAGCTLYVNDTFNQTNNSIAGNPTESFTIYDLQYVEYNWTVNCTDEFGNAGTSATWNFSVVNKTGPTVIISVPTTGSNFTQGYDIEFIGAAYDIQDGNMSGRSMVWTSDAGELLGFGTEILVSTLTPGNHTITLTATDSFGLSSTDTVDVTISANTCPGLEAGIFTITDITIDGNITDWDPVLNDPDNVITDGISGVTDPDIVQTADKDLRKFAFTFNEEWLWMYIRRSSGGANVIGLPIYFDYDQDGYLQSYDQVLLTGWSGSNNKYETTLYNYSPVNASGDPVTGDGVDEPGAITDPVGLETGIIGGNDNGIDLEFRVRWSDLGLPACSPVVAHISSALGGGTNLPSQIEDNMARFDSRIFGLMFYPDSTESGKQGTTVTHINTIRNAGNVPDLYDINITGTPPGYNVTVSFANGTLLNDTDGDGLIDTGYILPSYGYILLVNVSIPVGATSGDTDATTLTAISNANSVTKSVVDTTIVGAIAVIPNNAALAVKNTTIEYEHDVYNNDVPSIVNLQYSSSLGYTVTLHHPDGSLLTDTNFDTFVDIGYVSTGTITPIMVRIEVPPGAAIGDFDNTTILATSLFNESGNAYDATTVSERLSIVPNITTAGGIGSAVYLFHTVTYVSNTYDVVDLVYNQSQDYEIYLYEQDYVTLLTDTNNNSIIDLGVFGINGDIKNFLLKIDPIPPDEIVNTTNIIYYNVTTEGYSGIASARDNVSAQELVSYKDSAFIFQSYYFGQNETVYAKAFSLDMSDVYFQYIDPNASTARLSPYVPVDADETADDFYDFNLSYDLSGTWDLVVINKRGDAEISRISIQVNVPPVVLAVNDAPDPIYQGESVNFTANITAGEGRWFENESVVLGAYIEILGVNYSMTPPNDTEGIGEYYFDAWNTTNVSPGTHQYRVFAYDNFTFNNISTPGIGTITVQFYNITDVSGVITDSRYNPVNVTMYIYNSTGGLVWTDDTYYNFTLPRAEIYNVTIIPENGSLVEITYTGVIFPPNLTNFTRLEDTLENDTDKPEEIYNWTESIAWWTDPVFYYSQTVLNFTYGADTDLYFWKCSNWNFDDRNCTNNDFFIEQNLSDGPTWAMVYLSPGDPGAGAGRAPDYDELLRVWDVTFLNDTERRDDGTLFGEFYDLESVNLSVSRSYRFEILVTQTNNRTRGILRDPYYDNIQDEWIIDLTGIDSPNITQVNGSIVIDDFVPTVVSGSEAGTQKLIWDSAPPNKTVSDIDVGETAMFWFVVDIPSNATNETHEGHFLGKSKGQDAEIKNNLTTFVGSPPYKVNLTFPNNGNDTLVNRTLMFIWEPAYDPDNQTLSYEINITSEFCSDIYDVNITATNYTPIVELGTYDECGAYNWSVRAYDGYFHGEWSDSWNFSIQPYVALSFIVDTVDFGDADNDHTNDTTDDNPPPFLIQSDGNVYTDVVNVTSNQSFFTGASTIDSDFQLKVDNYPAEPGAFNWTGSAIDWINLTTIQTILDYFDWHDVNDSAEIEVKVHVPLDEPPGEKITGLVFYGEQS